MLAVVLFVWFVLLCVVNLIVCCCLFGFPVLSLDFCGLWAMVVCDLVGCCFCLFGL